MISWTIYWNGDASEKEDVKLLAGFLRPAQDELTVVSESTGHFLETCFGALAGPEDFLNELRDAYPRPNVKSITVPELDGDVKDFCKARRFVYNKALETALWKTQSLLSDAIGPLADLYWIQFAKSKLRTISQHNKQFRRQQTLSLERPSA